MEIASNYRAYSLRGAKTSRCQHKRKDTTALKEAKLPYSFLNSTIDCIPCCRLGGLKLDHLKINYDENTAYLIETTKTFCRNIGIEYAVAEKGTFLETVKALYTFLVEHLPPGHSLNIDYSQNLNMLVFIEYEECEFPTYSVFFTPVKCLDQYSGEDKEILLKFFAVLYKRTPLVFPEDHWDFSFATGECADLIEDDNYDKDYIELANSYRNGPIKSLFNEIYHECCNQKLEEELQNKINCYNYSKGKLPPSLVNSIKEGLELLNLDFLNNYRYQNTNSCLSEFTEDSQEDNLAIERLFCFCYSDGNDDQVTENALNFLNNDGGCYEQEVFTDFKVLSPEDKDVFVASDFPKLWSDWYETFFRQIQQYE